jgi:hypothetical protein
VQVKPATTIVQWFKSWVFLQKLAFIVALAIASVAGRPDVSHLNDGYDYNKPGCGAEGCGYDYPKPDTPFELPTETTTKPPNTYVPPPTPPPTYLPPE